jgi:transcription elongation factor Elf1
MSKRWQKTVRCPRCNTANVLKARELVSKNIVFNVDNITRICCWNCGEALQSGSLPYPFGIDRG